MLRVSGIVYCVACSGRIGVGSVFGVRCVLIYVTWYVLRVPCRLCGVSGFLYLAFCRVRLSDIAILGVRCEADCAVRPGVRAVWGPSRKIMGLGGRKISCGPVWAIFGLSAVTFGFDWSRRGLDGLASVNLGKKRNN